MHPVEQRPPAAGVSGFAAVPVAIERTRVLRHEVLRPHDTLEQVVAAEPPGAFAVGVFEHGKLIATGFVMRDEAPGDWRIRGMATVAAARGRGAGTAVLEALIEHARERGARRVWCNARTPALSLYQRAGLAVVSEEFELPRIGPHFVMERVFSPAT